jgi:hypothetical protein
VHYEGEFHSGAVSSHSLFRHRVMMHLKADTDLYHRICKCDTTNSTVTFSRWLHGLWVTWSHWGKWVKCFILIEAFFFIFVWWDCVWSIWWCLWVINVMRTQSSYVYGLGSANFALKMCSSVSPKSGEGNKWNNDVWTSHCVIMFNILLVYKEFFKPFPRYERNMACLK